MLLYSGVRIVNQTYTALAAITGVPITACRNCFFCIVAGFLGSQNSCVPVVTCKNMTCGGVFAPRFGRCLVRAIYGQRHCCRLLVGLGTTENHDIPKARKPWFSIIAVDSHLDYPSRLNALAAGTNVSRKTPTCSRSGFDIQNYIRSLRYWFS